MWKKPIICGLIIALGGAIAYVGAQDGSRPPALLPQQSARPLNAPSNEPLSRQLKSVQQEVVNEYANRDVNRAPQDEGASQLPDRQWRTHAARPASYREGSSTRAAYGSNPFVDDSSDEPEVPSILSGNRPRTSTPPATTPPTAGTPPSNTETQGTTDDEAIRISKPDSTPRLLNPTATGRLSDSSEAPSQPMLQATPESPMPTEQEPLLETGLGSPSDRQPTHTASLPTEPTADRIASPSSVADSIAPTQPAASLSQIDVESIGAQMRVSGEGPRTLKVGKPSTYILRARNISNIVANDAVLKINLPTWVSIIDATATSGALERASQDGAQVVEWRMSEVPAMSVHEINLQVIVNENRAFDLATELTTSAIASSNRIQVTQPKLDIAISGPTEIVYGQKVVLNIAVTNSGNGDAENVVVTLPEELGGQRSVLGNIAAGGIDTVQVELTARQQGAMDVSALVAADGVQAQTGDHQITVRRAALEVEVQAPQFKFAGSVAEVKILVQNVGDAPATSVIAATALPAGAVYESGIASAERVEGGIKWDVGDLAPGARMQYTVLCTLNQAGNAHFEAGVRDATQLGAADAADVMVEAVAELVLDVKDPKGPIPVGEDAIYELTIRNRGTKNARNVNLIAQFSEGIDPTEGIGMSSSIADGQVVFDPIPNVAPGQELVLRVKAKAAIAGSHVFRAHLTCLEPDTHRVFEANTRYFDAQGIGLSGGTQQRASSSPHQITPIRQSSSQSPTSNSTLEGPRQPTQSQPSSQSQPTPALQPATTLPSQSSTTQPQAPPTQPTATQPPSQLQLPR